jgi:hypothetical protein
MGCKAKANLTEDDAAAMEFFNVVRDQVIEGQPGPEGQRVLYPRLEGWIAACDLYEIPRARRAALVETARVLFDGIHGRLKVEQLHRIPESDLAPIGDEYFDG